MGWGGMIWEGVFKVGDGVFILGRSRLRPPGVKRLPTAVVDTLEVKSV